MVQFRGSELLEVATNQAEALRIAVNTEKDSILFYWEMGNIIHEPERTIVGRIIQEEKLHLQQLSGLKHSLQAR